MNKIILIEDRPGRQANFMDPKQLDELNKLEGIYIPKESNCRKIIKRRNESNKT